MFSLSSQPLFCYSVNHLLGPQRLAAAYWRLESPVHLLWCDVNTVCPHDSRSCVFVPVFVDDVADDERREEKQAVTGHSTFCLYVDLMDGDHLPLWCGCLPHHLLNNNDDRMIRSSVKVICF